MNAEKISLGDMLAYAENGEAGAGQLFARLYRGRFLAEKAGSGRNLWHRCADGVWQQDRLEEYLRQITEERNLFIDAGKNKNLRKADQDLLERAAARFTKLAFIKNTAQSAAHGEGSLAFDGSRFDQMKNLLPCANGILDPVKCSIGQDGKIRLDARSAFRPLRPEDYVRLTFTAFHPDAECPQWEAFLSDILDGDTEDGREVIRFLQTLMGYVMLGDPCQDIHIILYSANGRSGKGVFCKLLLKAFGGLGVTAKSGIFEKKPANADPNRAEPATMALKNKRLVVMSEQSKGAVYDAAEVKTKTSGRDEVTARALYGGQESFLPTYTFVQQTNTMPRMDADDAAFWARTIRINFPHTYLREPDPGDPAQKPIDTELEERLETELAGILNWCVGGAVRYIRAGCRLPPYPKLVRTAIDEYRAHEDSLAEFLGECCLLGGEYEVQSSALYKVYREWCEQSGRQPSGQKMFSDAMLKKHFSLKHTRQGNIFEGVGLLPAA